MINMDDETRKNVLGEVIYDELRIIREYLEDIPIIKQRLTNVEKDVAILKADINVMKALYNDLHVQVDKHEVQIGRLEAA